MNRKERRFNDRKRNKDRIRRDNTRTLFLDALHQNLDLTVNSGTRIRSLDKAPIDGYRTRANRDTIIKDLARIKPYVDASEHTFINDAYEANSSSTSVASQLADYIDTMYTIPGYAQTPDVRILSSGGSGISNGTGSSYTNQRLIDFVNACNNIFTLLQSNTAFSDIPIMSYKVFGPTSSNASGISYNDTNPFGSGAPAQNAIGAFADAASTNVAAMCTTLMCGRMDKLLLDIFAKRHPNIAGYLMNAKALISQPKFRAVLEQCAKIISRIPVDVEGVDRVVRLSCSVSMKSDSIMDPIVYTSSSFGMPAYQVGVPGDDTYRFTPDFRNTNGRTESASQPFYASHTGYGSAPNAQNLVSQLNSTSSSTTAATIITNGVNKGYGYLTSCLTSATTFVNMMEPGTALVRLAAQVGISKGFGYTCPYLEEYELSYEPNIHNLLRYPSVSQVRIAENGNVVVNALANKGKIDEDSVSPYRLHKVSTEFYINSANNYTDGYDNNMPHMQPLGYNNTINTTNGLMSGSNYQFPEMMLYTYVYVTSFSGDTICFYQSNYKGFTSGSQESFYATAYAGTPYNGSYDAPGQNNNSITNDQYTNMPPMLSYITETFGAIAPLSSGSQYIGGSPVLLAYSQVFDITVVVPNIVMQLQNDFLASIPFRTIMRNPGNSLLLG